MVIKVFAMKPIARALLLLTFALNCLSSEAQEPSNRFWNECLLNTIRLDLARPNVHARNLYHHSLGQYAITQAHFGLQSPAADPAWTPPLPAGDLTDSVTFELAMAGFTRNFVYNRYYQSPNYIAILTLVNDEFLSRTGVSYAAGSSDPWVAWGEQYSENLLDDVRNDGSNEIFDYDNLCYTPVNDPMDMTEAWICGTAINDVNHWQPLAFDGSFIDQSGNEIFVDVPAFSGANWGLVAPFVLDPSEASINTVDGCIYPVYLDPGPPVLLGEASDNLYNWQTGFGMVAAWQAQLDAADGVMIDISPASIGNIGNTYPENPDHLYDYANGGDFSPGYMLNPVTGEPYTPQIVPRGDYGRVLAEFWADGPDSETPPGHWFTILHDVMDAPEFTYNWKGTEGLDPELWITHAHLLLGGTMHDAAIAAWSVKGYYDFVRPITAIRYMLGNGQSTDPLGPNYDVNGIPLIPGAVEIVQAGDPLIASGDAVEGDIKIKQWLGSNEGASSTSNVDWTVGCEWWPYQRPTFVTPPFAGYVSGHSTYSRAAADVLTHITGSRYFPGGKGAFTIPQDTFLAFESGPSVALTLEWAAYQDAADQCSLSRIWGGIHPPMDDIRGREIGKSVAQQTTSYYDTLNHLPSDAAVVGGCTYDNATNYLPEANDDDGSCIFPAVSDCKDFDGDGLVSAPDLLAVLGVYGTTCE